LYLNIDDGQSPKKKLLQVYVLFGNSWFELRHVGNAQDLQACVGHIELPTFLAGVEWFPSL
jgi:hypothetical protein